MTVDIKYTQILTGSAYATLRQLFESTTHDLNSDQPLSTPIQRQDLITVYHNFRSLEHAVHAVQHGLSGRVRAPRVYSYEGDNNPRGLFVSPQFRAVDEFGHYIIEFAARASDLELPVWPGGGYTVQGQMSQNWGHGHAGQRTRLAAQRQQRSDVASRTDLPPAVLASWDPALAHMLTSGREPQALFRGNLRASDIVAVYVRKDNRIHSWSKLSPGEFLAEYAGRVEPNYKLKDRAFTPDQDFDAVAWVQAMSQRFGYEDPAEMLDIIQDVWRSQVAAHPKHRAKMFLDAFGQYFWPQQLLAAYR